MGRVVRSVQDFEEREKVLQLLYRAFPQTPPDFFPRRTFFDRSYTPSNTFILMDHGKIVSTAQVYYGSLRVFRRKIRFAGIGNVATHPRYQGQGYGTALLQAIHNFLREKSEADLCLLFTGTPSFYERLGYQRFQIQEYQVSISKVPTVQTSIWTFSPEFIPDLVKVHRRYTQRLVGPVAKNRLDFEAQLKYVLEDRSLFLMSVSQGSVQGYIRIGTLNASPVVLEFASTDPLYDFPALVHEVLQRLSQESLSVGLSYYEWEEYRKIEGFRLTPVSRRNILFFPLRDHSDTVNQLLREFQRFGNFWLADVY